MQSAFHNPQAKYAKVVIIFLQKYKMYHIIQEDRRLNNEKFTFNIYDIALKIFRAVLTEIQDLILQLRCFIF